MKKLSIFLSTVFCSVVLFRSIGGMEKKKSHMERAESYYDEKIKALLQKQTELAEEWQSRISRQAPVEIEVKKHLREVDQLLNNPEISQNERIELVEKRKAIQHILDLMPEVLSYGEEEKAILQRDIEDAKSMAQRVARQLLVERKASDRIREIDQLIEDSAISKNERTQLVEKRKAAKEALKEMRKTF